MAFLSSRWGGVEVEVFDETCVIQFGSKTESRSATVLVLSYDLSSSMQNDIIAQRYQILDELGRGGMAIVYRALDTNLQREVAIKVLHPHLASNDESSKRFLLESKAIAKLHHPNIIEIFDASYDEKTKSHFLVMELIQGLTLRAFAETHPIHVPELGVAVASCVCDALQHAHENGVIHRDIKPENIMFSQDGLIKLMDFGIARVLDSDRVTTSGTLLGSPAHMPPEVIEGERYTLTCDIFSLGTVLYYTTTGALPFQGVTPMAVFKSILDGRYKDPCTVNPSISKELKNVIQTALQREPALRYQSAADFKAALQPILLDIGVNSCTDFLKDYLKNPSVYEKQLIQNCIAIFSKKAEQSIKNKKIPCAINYIDRILDYEPNNSKARTLLHQVHSNQITTKTLVTLIAFTCLLIAFVAWKFILKPNEFAPILDTSEQNDPTPTKQNIILAYEKDSFQNSKEIHNAADENPSMAVAISTPTTTTSSLPMENSPVPTQQEIKQIPEDENDLANANNPHETKDKLPQKTANPKRNPPTRSPSPKPSNEPHSPSPTAPPPLELPLATPSEQTQRTTVVLPVYPPDSYAILSGKRYLPNASGDITFELPEGHYNVTLTCKERCNKRVYPLNVPPFHPNTPTQKLEVVSLTWADASLVLNPPKTPKVYFVARRLDLNYRKIHHLVPKSPNAISGFNAFGKEIQLEIYAIPQDKILTSYELSDLERSKFASTRISLSPGENRILDF